MSEKNLQLQQKKYLNISINNKPFYNEKYIYEENPILAHAGYVKSRGGGY